VIHEVSPPSAPSPDFVLFRTHIGRQDTIRLLGPPGRLCPGGLLAGYWGATKQFLGSAWHAPRVPIVVLLALPLLLVALERFSRGSSWRADSGRSVRQEASDATSG
jgi:hypothetical protein